ncbi:MAG: acyltransferase [Lachnospiraceae bacterium]
MKTETERKYYIDNLRWACILLLIPFHTAMAWNCWGEGNYIWFYKNRILSSFIVFISPWYMALLFVLAGISARLALRKKTYGCFIRERIRKLLLPLIAGMCTAVALMAYYADKFHNGYQGSFLSHYSIFFTRLTAFNGYDGGWTPGHLWFLLYLFIISMLGLGMIFLQEKYLPKLNFEKMNAGGIAFLAVLLPFSGEILNIAGKSIGLYMVLYLIGYYVIAEDRIMDKIVKHRHVYLLIMLLADAVDVYLFIWTDYADVIFNSIAMYTACWFGILALLGFAKSGFCQNNRITRYLTGNSFLIYLFHFMWIILTQFYLSKVTDNMIVLFVGSVLCSLLMTLTTCEIVKRIPLFWLFFGGPI